MEEKAELFFFPFWSRCFKKEAVCHVAFITQCSPGASSTPINTSLMNIGVELTDRFGQSGWAGVWEGLGTPFSLRKKSGGSEK